MNSCPMLCGDSMLGLQKGDLAEQNLWYKATMCYYHTHSWRITATKKALVHVKGTTAIGTRLHSKYQMFLCQQYTSCSPWTHQHAQLLPRICIRIPPGQNCAQANLWLLYNQERLHTSDLDFSSKEKQQTCTPRCSSNDSVSKAIKHHKASENIVKPTWFLPLGHSHGNFITLK